jgi:CO/xanthine dehydrogenase Mo-binding subunit
MTAVAHGPADGSTAAGNAGLAANPYLSQWVEFTAGERVVLRVGKVELGQGIVTALVQIAAEELDVDPARVDPVASRTDASPDEGMTAGSKSVMDGGAAVRQVCAGVRAVLLDEAARRLGRPRAELRVADGGVYVDTEPGAEPRTSYWRLARPGLLDVTVDTAVRPKPVADHTLVGRPLARLDLADKLTGRPRFVQDLDLDGKVFARVVRPPAPGARLVSVDEQAARALGTVVAVVRRGSFLAVVAEREEDAVRGAERLRVNSIWSDGDELPEMALMADYLAAQPVDPVPVARTRDPGAADRVHTMWTARYFRPYVAHASIAPGGATAQWHGDRLDVWTHSQGVYPLRAQLARALGLEADDIVVRHVEGAGCYGHNSADDVAFDAALLAQALPGRPVQVSWSREDEFAWEPYAPAALVEVTAGLDASGDVVTWRQESRSGGHNGRPGYDGQPGLLGAWHVDDAPIPTATDYPLAAGGGVGRNGDPGYAIAELDVTANRVLTMPLRTSSLRGLGATANVFAIESAMDELALRAGADPVAYRLRHLRDPRARAVLEQAAGLAGWDARPERDSVGWGVAYSRYKNVCGYCAVVACVEAVSDVKVRHLYIAVDAGQVINPDGLRNQIEGGAVQATSWTLLEEVTFDQKTVTSRDWDGYPVLRFSDVPRVDVELISRPHEPPLGVGEVAGGPVTAAIANALADAIGVRMRRLPLTPEHIAAAIEED